MRPPWALDLMNVFNVTAKRCIKDGEGYSQGVRHLTSQFTNMVSTTAGDPKDTLTASYLMVIVETSRHLIS